MCVAPTRREHFKTEAPAIEPPTFQVMMETGDPSRTSRHGRKTNGPVVATRWRTLCDPCAQRTIYPLRSRAFYKHRKARQDGIAAYLSLQVYGTVASMSWCPGILLISCTAWKVSQDPVVAVFVLLVSHDSPRSGEVAIP